MTWKLTYANAVDPESNSTRTATVDDETKRADEAMPRAREFIRSQGAKIGDHSLADYASRGGGPKYFYGRDGAMYTPEELQKFVDELKAKQRK